VDKSDSPRTSSRRRWALRGLVLAFYVALGAVLVSVARNLDLAEIVQSLQSLPMRSLLLAGACSILCYAAYVGYEILAATVRALPLPTRRVALIGFTSYACNLSLGAIFGALGVRMRLYARQGIAAADSLAVVALNLLTNWSGYLLVLGALLVFHTGELPAAWPVNGGPARAAGAVILAAALAYPYACARARRREWSVRGHTFELPGLRTAATQFALSIPGWLATAGSLAFLLADVAFDQVAIALLASAFIGLVIRVPAGIGVVEAVFVASFGPELGHARVLAALIAFRCIHYLVPLTIALTALAVQEWSARGSRRIKADGGARARRRAIPVS